MPVDLTVLTDWLDACTTLELHNEDDVESKFVHPLFRLLGYPESHRRGKYPVTIQAGRKGRKHEVDQVYFATADTDQQIIGNALVVVEAKRTGVSALDEAVAQAQSYAEKLRPLLIAVTNGRQLQIFRRRHFDRDEKIIDCPIQDLGTTVGAQQLTTLLSFETILAQHAKLNDLAHEQFVKIDRALRAHPDIQEILAEGDFPEGEARTGQNFRVKRAKVAIVGELPICLSGGSCVITFSHMLRRGLQINLDHAGIMGTLMVGIDSKPDWDTRHFIERETEDIYVARLGNIETRLSYQEAQDLCTCVDSFAGAYRDVMMQAEDSLDSWYFPMSAYERGPAFYLTSVHPSFWRQVRQFADEHSRFLEIKDEWSCFESWKSGFRISHERGDHAWIEISNKLRFGSPPGSHLLMHVVYDLLDGQPIPDMDVQDSEWQQNIGLSGQWNVPQTYEWLTEKLFPEVERRSRGSDVQPKERVYYGHVPYSPNSKPHAQKDPIESSDQFVRYITDIQRWLTWYSARRLQTSLITPLYSCLLNIARNADPAKLDLHYIVNNMARVEDEAEPAEDNTIPAGWYTFLKRSEALMSYLDQMPTVSSYMLDRVMRSFYALYEDAPIAVSQTALNQTWQVLKPLWRLAQFEQRHVWPHVDGRR